MVGSLKVGDQIHRTHNRFRNISDYEAYYNSIDEGYDAKNVTFNGYIYKINTPQFTYLLYLNTEMIVISNMNLLNIEVITVSYQQKVIVLLKVLIS